MKLRPMLTVPMLLAGTVLGPAILAATNHQKARVVAIHEAVLKTPFDDAAVKTYLATLPRDGAYFIVEGDILMTEQQVRVFLASKSAAPRPPGPELTVNVVDGETDYWKDSSRRILSYAIDRRSFPAEPNYQLLVADLKSAGQEWENACPECGVKFVHLDRFDANPAHSDVLFIVRRHDSQGRYIAAAFFPSYAQARRYVNIDPSYYTTSFDRVGVLRHELGHVLGYRHEHIRGIAGCFEEDNQWRPLTDYDPRSVMHYFCGGGGNMQLTLTDLDRSGHRALYIGK